MTKYIRTVIKKRRPLEVQRRVGKRNSAYGSYSDVITITENSGILL